MLYLLDANVLITAHSQYYPIDRVPEFWEWLAYQAELGHVKMPIETYEEVTDGSLLYGWVRDPQRKGAILLDEAVDQSLLDQVVSQGYAPDLTEIELEQVGFDPFLVAYGLASPSDRCVVTLENSRPSKLRQNRQVPDVCNTLGVTWCNPIKMYHTLGFSTDWRSRLRVVPQLRDPPAPPSSAGGDPVHQ